MPDVEDGLALGDVRTRKIAEPDDVELYRPWAQQSFSFLSIDVRSNLSVDAVTKLVRSALATVDPGLAVAGRSHHRI